MTEEGAEGDEDEEVLPHIPTSFDFEDLGGGASAARGAGAGTVDPFNAVQCRTTKFNKIGCP